MTKQDAMKLMAVLKAAYPMHEVSEDTFRLYVSRLLDLEVEHAARGIHVLICTLKFFPSLSEVRRAAADAAKPTKPAELSWGEVTEAISRWGMYRQPKFDDPITAAAVAVIGWQNICQTPVEELGTLRAQFRRTYEAVREQEVRSRQIAPFKADHPLGRIVAEAAKRLTEPES